MQTKTPGVMGSLLSPARAYGVVFLALMLFLSCDANEPEADERTPVLESLASGVIVPRYVDFQLSMEAASQAISTFCKAPTEAGLTESRQLLSAAYIQWKRSEVIAFGPHHDQPWAIAGRIDLWPARPDNIQELLDGSEPIDADFMPTTMNGAKGLPAIQWLLWAESDDTLLAFSQAPHGERRCQILEAMAVDVTIGSQEMVQAWQPDGENWIAELIAPPGPLNRFAGSEDGVSELVNRMIFTVENIRLLKLGKPLGLDSGGTPQPNRLESAHSGDSLQACLANLQGVNDLFLGNYEEYDGLGLVDLLPESRQEELIQAFDSTYTQSLSALSDITEPLAHSIENNPESVQAAIDQLLSLQYTLQVEIAAALAVTVRFNDTDGD